MRMEQYNKHSAHMPPKEQIQKIRCTGIKMER